MRSLKIESIQEIIRLEDWTARNQGKWKWKVTGTSGSFTLHELGSLRWRFVYGSQRQGNQRRLSFDAAGIQEAVRMTTQILFGCKEQPKQEKIVLTIDQVFTSAWESSGGEPYHKATLQKHARYFRRWCRQNRLICWHELLNQHLRAYATFQIKRGCCRKTVQHYLEPVTLASTWVATNYPDEYWNICQGFRLPNKAGNVLRYGDKKHRAYLPIALIVEFLEWRSSGLNWVDNCIDFLLYLLL